MKTKAATIAQKKNTNSLLARFTLNVLNLPELALVTGGGPNDAEGPSDGSVIAPR